MAHRRHGMVWYGMLKGRESECMCACVIAYLKCLRNPRYYYMRCRFDLICRVPGSDFISPRWLELARSMGVPMWVAWWTWTRFKASHALLRMGRTISHRVLLSPAIYRQGIEFGSLALMRWVDHPDF